MTASELARLKSADFNQLTASEYGLVERLVRDIPLPLPTVAARRTRAGSRGARGCTGGALARGGADRRRRDGHHAPAAPPPAATAGADGRIGLSSMERYARLLLAFCTPPRRALVAGQRQSIRPDVLASARG
ncbi:MAG: hypothetical protein U1F38_08070 [Ottowia sp.]